MTYADVGARDTSRGKPWRAELAAQLGVSEKTLDRTVFEGECAGLWTVHAQTRPVTEGADPKKINDANIYVLRDAEFWRNEWVDPLESGQKAADVAKARVSARVEAKRAAGIEPMGGRKKKPQVEGGVTSDATSSGGGGVMGDATPGVMGDATPGVMGDALIKIPVVESPPQEPASPPVRPSVGVEDPRANETDGRTGAVDSEEKQAEARPTAEGGDPAAADATPQSSSNEGAVPATPGMSTDGGRETTPGMEVLARVGRLNETFKLAGKPFLDQARELDMRIADSEAAGDAWRVSDLVSMLSAPLNGPIRVSAGAVIADRIRKLPRTPRSAMLMLPGQSTGEDRPMAGERSVPNAADRTVNDSIARRTRGECPECRADSPGGTVCGDCLGWPKCVSGCGRAVRGGGTCETCEYAAHHATIAATASEDGKCPGHGGKPCGKRAVTLGLCATCRIKAETDRNSVIADWETARDQIVAAAKAAEERQPENAPF
ncbi:hypothetical protein OG352_39820 (plasmid) [Streptomyces sp. NBC_01485]|uniref:hypothetical protein n=1 Tax=Streptomyces sp. NBC_01485 TaxID=2903884 RepID=UPI002E2FF0E1|nr:hypothetical protein [Streptomyces sp. NBC_01485]